MKLLERETCFGEFWTAASNVYMLLVLEWRTFRWFLDFISSHVMLYFDFTV